MIIVHGRAATGLVQATKLILSLVPELAAMATLHYRGLCIVCVCTRACVCVRARVCAYACACVRLYVLCLHLCVCMYVCMCLSVCVLFVYVCVCLCDVTNMYVCMYVCIHVCKSGPYAEILKGGF